jgi:4-hydroxybenzoate polyprenyltransferase
VAWGLHFISFSETSRPERGHIARGALLTYPGAWMPLDVNAIVLLAVGSLLVGSLPFYPYSKRWGYVPSVLLGLLLLVMFIIAFS